MPKTPMMHIEDRQALDVMDKFAETGAESIIPMPLFQIDEHGQLDRVPKPAVMRLHDEIDGDHMAVDAVTQTTTAHLYAQGRKGLEPVENVVADLDDARYVVITQQLVVDLDSDYLTDEVRDLMDQILSFPRLAKLEEQRSVIEDEIDHQRELWEAATQR